MKVRMTTISAGPKGVLPAEAIVDLPDPKAKELIDRLSAVPADPGAVVTAKWPHSTDVPKATK